MSRIMLALMFVLGLASPALAGHAVEHSGTIVAIDRGRNTISLEEMGPWHGPGSGLVRRTIALTPDTRVALVSRTGGVGADGWPGSFTRNPIRTSDLRVGDYVTVTTPPTGHRLLASRVTVDRAAPAAPHAPEHGHVG